MIASRDPELPEFVGELQDSLKRESDYPPAIARTILLERTRIQDVSVSALRYAPTTSYLIISIVYTPLMLISSKLPVSLTSLWLMFCLTLLLSGVIWWCRIANAVKLRDAYEVAALKTSSGPFPTWEGIWADRLTEVRYLAEKDFAVNRWILSAVELVAWLSLASIAYIIAQLNI
jgi:hypothetical protein